MPGEEVRLHEPALAAADMVLTAAAAASALAVAVAEAWAEAGGAVGAVADLPLALSLAESLVSLQLGPGWGGRLLAHPGDSGIPRSRWVQRPLHGPGRQPGSTGQCVATGTPPSLRSRRHAWSEVHCLP